MNTLELAIKYAKETHKGERFKYIEGVYYEHVKAVAARMHSIDEKVVATLHDVVERKVELRLGKSPSRTDEETVIQDELAKLARYFRAHGCPIDDKDSLILASIDVLTKRRHQIYHEYTERLLDHTHGAHRQHHPQAFIALKAKKGDMTDNMDPERNPPENMQSASDRARLLKYEHTLAIINARYPEREFPQMKLHPFKRHAAVITRKEKVKEPQRPKKYPSRTALRGRLRRYNFGD